MTDETKPPADAPLALVGPGLDRPMLSVANKATDAATAPIPVSPTGLAILGQTLIKIMLPLVLVAGVLASLPEMGVSIPFLLPLVPFAKLVVALGAAFGIASQGVRKAA